MRRFSVSKTVLLIICLMYLILNVDRVNISMAAPLIKADLGLSNTQLGLAFSAFAYPYALFQLIGGYFGDKFGRASHALRQRPDCNRHEAPTSRS
jgi:MFS family permease